LSYAKIKYTPLKYIEPFHKERESFFIRAIITGYGGGKTYAGCMELIQVSAINRKIPNIYIEPTYQMVKDILYPQMISILDENSIPYEINKSEHNFYFPLWNGIVWLRSGDKPEKIKGVNVGLIGIDEPFIQDEEIYKIAISRTRHPKARIKGLFFTGTPEQLNWGYRILEEDKKENTKVYSGSTYDNIHLPSSYVESLLTHYSDKEVRAYVRGEFVNLALGLAYYPFSNDNVKEFKYVDYRPLEISCDFNIDLMSWSIGQEINGIDYEFDYVELEGFANTELMCQTIKNKFPNHNGHIIFYGDISGNQRHPEASLTNWAIIREQFPAAVITYQKIKNIKDRVDAYNGRLCNSKLQRKAFVTSNMKRLIGDLRQVTWEMLLTKSKAGLFTHASDAVSYKMFSKYPLTGKPTSEWKRL